MGTRVLGEIDQLGSLANAPDRSFSHVHRIADQRNHAAVMVRVHLAVQQIDAVHLHGFDDGIDASLVASFRKVWYTFDECGHKEQDKARGARSTCQA